MAGAIAALAIGACLGALGASSRWLRGSWGRYQTTLELRNVRERVLVAFPELPPEEPREVEVGGERYVVVLQPHPLMDLLGEPPLRLWRLVVRRDGAQVSCALAR